MKKVQIDPKKSLSQNFLIDQQMQQNVTSSMLDFIDTDRLLIEVGPGQGDLTKYFLDTDLDFQAIEIDTRAGDYLINQTNLNKLNNLNNLSGKNIILADANNLIQNQKLPDNFNMVSNLPFNIGSRLLVEMGIYYPATKMAVILQLEVAKKLVLNNKNLTFLGCFLNLFFECSLGLKISPSCFYPAPKVFSAMVFLKPKQLPEHLLELKDRARAKSILKDLFLSPRKTVFNNLITAGENRENIET